MREIKNVLICGLGAIGSIYADKINTYNCENLKILADKTRFERYTKTPKIFNGKELKLKYILPDTKDYKADLIIITTKYDGLCDVIENIKNFVTDNTIIISLINGVTSEEIIAQKYGWKNILHSYYIGSSAIRNGNNITNTGDNTIVFGVKNPIVTNNENIDILKNYFDKAGIQYEIPEDIWRSLWLKFMLNVSCNQVSAILGITFEQLQKPQCKNLIINIMQEVAKIAKAKGVKNTETMIDETLLSISKISPEGKTSMLQDIEAKRHTELDIFAKTVMKFGKELNIPTPINETLNDMIEIIESQY